MLHGSWATAFSENVFPKIDENRFALLYAQDAASRPNAPVNIIIGAMPLKQSYGLTDEAVVEIIAFNLRWQETLHTTSFTLVTDCAYGSCELIEQAQRQNIDFVTTALNGTQTNPLIEILSWPSPDAS